jgi:nitroreductase
MDIREAIKSRHSVRYYRNEPIAEETRAELEALIGACNEESGLHMQLIVEDPECFDTLLAHYGMFKNVRNYIAVVGPKDMANLEEKGGYYGQKVVIAAQQMGLNTCWVAGTYKRGKCKAVLEDGEKIVCVIAIGYGESEGTRHKSKPLSKICDIPEADMPVWFKNGVKAAMMAPTAMNQQKFKITLEGGRPVITAGAGPMTRIDLGIVKYNFEAVSGHKV